MNTTNFVSKHGRLLILCCGGVLLIILLCHYTGKIKLWNGNKNPVNELQQIVQIFSNRVLIVKAPFEVDVKSTDSLISPYKGSIFYSPSLGDDLVVNYETGMVYKNGRWAFNTLRYNNSFNGVDSGWRESHAKFDREEVNSWKKAVDRFYEDREKTPFLFLFQ